MPADSKTSRRGSGGRNAESAKRSTSRRGGGEEEGGRGRKSAATSSRKSASSGRKAAGKEAGGGRKAASKKSAAKGAASRRGASTGKSAKKASGGRAAGGRARASKMDALSLLKEDHERVDQMFKRYERLKEGDERKREMLQDILEEVRVHAQVEEELFYPALRTVLEEDGKDKELKLVAEADVEHETVKWLMSELEGGQLDQEMVDARVKVMGEYIRHHVEEEEGQIFRAAKRSDIDLAELGRQMDARKRELMGEPAEEGDLDEMGAMMAGGGEGAQQRSQPSGTH